MIFARTILTALIICFLETVCAQIPASLPNIVIILADDLGYGDLSAYGATRIKTPNIDRLAAEGMRFTDAHSPHSVCTPSRYGLLTGRYAWRTWNGSGTVWSDDPLLTETSRLTLPKLFHSVGYHTAIIGKWHLGFGAPGAPGWDDKNGPDYNLDLKPGPLEVGFDYFFGVPHVGQFPHVYIENHRIVGLDPSDPIRIVLDPKWNRTSYRQRLGTPAHTFTGGTAAKYQHEDLGVKLTEKAVEWIDQQSREPFLLYVAHRNPHGPYRPNGRFKGTSEIGAYGDMINELDWSVGEILKALKGHGLTENTLVLFASDNGGVTDYKDSKIAEIAGHRLNGPWFGQKTEAYEGGCRVPLLVRWPGKVRPGSTSNALVALTDVIATCAELLGKRLPVDAGEDSFSFLSALLGSQSVQPTRQSIVQDSSGGMFAIREGAWKLILGQGGGGFRWISKPPDPTKPSAQLYNLADVPGERKNLLGSQPLIEARLRSLLREIQSNGRSR
ncbi:MAG TPA: arylsulfatase [Opitutaceae bacterium]|nr:arylsulfatase [Opitutaceae bacterium]